MHLSQKVCPQTEVEEQTRKFSQIGQSKLDWILFSRTRTYSFTSLFKTYSTCTKFFFYLAGFIFFIIF
jgi:hypothetical protein